MIIHVHAEIPLKSELLNDALVEFALFVEQQLVVSEGAEVSVAMTESGTRGNSVLARHLPDETKDFGLDWIPRGTPLTAMEFLAAIRKQKPKKTRSQLRMPATSASEVGRLLRSLAESFPSSGRGVMLLFGLVGWRFASDGTGPAVDAAFSRFRHGARAISATAALRFQALSLKDRIVAATISRASELTGLDFGKPMAGFPGAAASFPSVSAPVIVADSRLEPAPAEAELVVLQTFDEAFMRAADQIGARTEDLDAMPLLLSRFKSGEKRIRDVMAGKKEKIDLPSRLKQFMKESFPEYVFSAADTEQLFFRKPIGSTLDLLLMFDRIHHWGLGKSFSLDFAVDFPNTPFGGMYSGWGGTRANLFRMFHQGLDKQVWTYTTSAELATVVDGCGKLLSRVLPALETQCRELLLPPPAALPAGIERRGSLSAREAYEAVLPTVVKWASDAQLESVGSTNILMRREGVISSITREGRLEPHGSWSFKFISRSLDRYCHYTVPNTGRIQWNTFAVPQGGVPKYSSVLEADSWIDSTQVAQRGFTAVEEQLAGWRMTQIWITLHDPKRYGGDFVWEAHCNVIGSSLSDRRDIRVHFHPVTGEFLRLDRVGEAE